MIETVLALRAEGLTLREIREELHRRRFWPRRNGHWCPPERRARGRWAVETIRRVIRRAEQGE